MEDSCQVLGSLSHNLLTGETQKDLCTGPKWGSETSYWSAETWMPIVAFCHLIPRSLCCSGQVETEMASPEWVRLLSILCPQVEAHLRAQAKMQHISKATFLCPLPTEWVVRESVPPIRGPLCASLQLRPQSRAARSRKLLTRPTVNGFQALDVLPQRGASWEVFFPIGNTGWPSKKSPT